MAKEKIPFESFLAAVPEEHKEFIAELNTSLLNSGCTLSIELAKSGYTTTYRDGTTKKALLNFVFRKTGMLMRLYGGNAAAYTPVLETLPEEMVAIMDNATNCKRLLGGECSDTCPGGTVFTSAGKLYQKCRYNCFFFPVSFATQPHLKALATCEITARKSANG